MTIGGHHVISEPSPGKSWLATDPAGHKVVLKHLPADCLLGGQLNPTVADRLRRVREIAMTSVANLRGVERDGDRVFLVWDYVEASPIDQHLRDQKSPAREIVRELVRTVQHFHATGLVHGAIHERNVLVDPAGRVWLIDVSPLLYLDPARDERAVMEMLRRLDVGVLEEILPKSDDVPATLHDLSTRLRSNHTERQRPPRTSIRRRTVFAALLMTILGVGAGVMTHRALQNTQQPSLTPPRAMK